MKNADPYVSAIVNGDRTKIRELYDEYYPHVESWIKERGGERSDALDVFQSALEIILIQAEKSEKVYEIEFRPYFFRICRNKWIDQVRLRKKEEAVRKLEEERVNNNSDEIQLADQGMKEAWLSKAMEATFIKLTETCQKLINLTQSGADANEVSKALNMTNANTVYRRKFGCMKRWRELLEAHPMYQQYKNEVNE